MQLRKNNYDTFRVEENGEKIGLLEKSILNLTTLTQKVGTLITEN
jgi:hypothetical protein